MKRIYKSLAVTCLSIGFASFAAAATSSMEGTISDSMCGASHAKMMEMHKDAKMTDRDCTLACVKGGGKYVFVSGGKVYNVANQNLPALAQSAGQTVSLTGNVEGDTLTVTKISAKK
jgi:hypothetical protein